MLLAGSFSETYKRNAINNGYIVIEALELVKRLKDEFGTEKPTVRTGHRATLNFRTSILKIEDATYLLPPLGAAAQEFVLAGGLENWVKERF